MNLQHCCFHCRGSNIDAGTLCQTGQPFPETSMLTTLQTLNPNPDNSETEILTTDWRKKKQVGWDKRKAEFWGRKECVFIVHGCLIAQLCMPVPWRVALHLSSKTLFFWALKRIPLTQQSSEPDTKGRHWGSPVVQNISYDELLSERDWLSKKTDLYLPLPLMQNKITNYSIFPLTSGSISKTVRTLSFFQIKYVWFRSLLSL